MESPEGKKVFFIGRKERPKEAPFVTFKKTFFDEDLERKAGIALNETREKVL